MLAGEFLCLPRLRLDALLVEAAGDPDAYPDAGEPWQPLKLYYHHAFHRERTQALHDDMVARGLESPYAERLAAALLMSNLQAAVRAFAGARLQLLGRRARLDLLGKRARAR